MIILHLLLSGMYRFLLRLHRLLKHESASIKHEKSILYWKNMRKREFIEIIILLYDDLIRIYYQIKKKKADHPITSLPRELLYIIFSYIIDDSFSDYVYKTHYLKYYPMDCRFNTWNSSIDIGININIAAYVYRLFVYFYQRHNESKNILCQFNNWTKFHSRYFSNAPC
jgi:hypothetical protein